jgi:hypothetical protein
MWGAMLLKKSQLVGFEVGGDILGKLLCFFFYFYLDALGFLACSQSELIMIMNISR